VRAQRHHYGAIEDQGYLIDRATQTWVRATGKRLDFADAPWLVGPVGGRRRIAAEDWVRDETIRLGAELVEGGGLLGTFDDLAGPGFDPTALAPAVVEFYERTSRWRLEAWSQWCPVAWPFGWLLSAVFARRLQQLALPLRPLDVAHGMASRVLATRREDGSQVGAAWLRTLRSTGQTVYSGWYGVTCLPHKCRPSVRVMFPLPNGSIAVFLRPDVADDGSLLLTSPLGEFGDDGAYLVVVDRERECLWSRRVPLAEQFRVFVDDEGVLRTDHALGLGRVHVLRLHYRLDDRPTA